MRDFIKIIYVSCIVAVMAFVVIGCGVRRANDDITEYTAEEYSLSYCKDSFKVFEGTDSNSVTFSYCNEGVEPAGSNVLTFYAVKDIGPRELLEKKIESLGLNISGIREVRLAATPEICWHYVQSGSSVESGLTTSQIFYAIPCGNDTILVDGFRTIGPDEGTETSIDADFEYIMDTLTLNN